MAFPETPLGVRVEIQTGQVWTDITAQTKTADPITASRGIRNSGSNADPASVPLKIDNRGGQFSPRNPVSPYYGLIGRNTPVRVWIPGGPHFLDLNGDPANYTSTPDTTALDITGDIDLRWEGEINWSDPAPQMLIGKWGSPGGRSWHMRIQSGLLYFGFSQDGSIGLAAWQYLPDLPRRAALRVTVDVDNGAGAWVVRHYWAPSITGPWTQFASDLVTAGTMSFFNSASPLAVGAFDTSLNPPRGPFRGRCYAAEVRSGINGTIVASPNFQAQPVGAAGFTDSAGRAWTFAGTAAVADRQERFRGEISSWPQRWVPSGQSVWTSVEAAGILRRYGQGQKALDSTLRRRIPSGAPLAYWPMEEAREATRAYSPLKAVSPAALTGVEFASVDTLPSSRALPRLTGAATLSAIVPAHPTPTQWQVEFVYNADDKAPAAAEPHPEVISISATGTVRRWSVGLRNGSGQVYGYDSSGTAIVNQGVALGSDVFHGWVRLQFWAREVSGIITWGLFFQDVGGSAGGISRTVSGTVGRVTAVTGDWGAATEGWALGHLSVVPVAESTLYNGSDDGYAGETAWERMLRLCSEESVPMSHTPGSLPTQRVGPQRPETLLALLQAAAEADGGMLLESQDRLGLVYRDRSSLYTQEPALTLAYRGGGLAPPLEPVDDDTATRNDITVTRDAGSSARAVLESGVLSVQEPPYGIGLYDESTTLSLADDTQPEPIAHWRLHLGTYDGARYPSVRVLLHRAPELMPSVLALREGDLIRLTGLPPWVAYGPVDLLVTGWSETMLPRTWEIVFTCVPAGPWMTAKADHAVYGKADTDGSALAGPISATDTAVPVRATAGPPWTTDPQETPIEVQFGGEVARVDAVGQLLSTNPWLESDLSGWVGQVTAAVTYSTAVHHPRGVASAMVTPTGSAASNSFAMAARSPGVAGQSYTACFWVYSPSGWADFRVSIDWFTSAGAGNGTTSGPQTTVPPGQWTFMTFTTTAPAGTASIVARCRQGTTPPASSLYHVWGLRLLGPGGGSTVLDTFGRTVANGWGNADTGQPWTTFNGTVSDFSVNGTQGVISHTTRNVFRYAALSLVVADVETLAQFTVPVMPTGDSIYTYVLSRTNTAVTSYLFARVEITTSGVVALSLRKRNPTEVLLATAATTLTHVAGQSYKVRFRVEGSTLSARVWVSTAPEPSVWHSAATDTDPLVPAAGGVGFRSFIGTTNTNALPVLTPVDDFQISDSQVFTVTRSVNGVAKSHAAGTAVSLAHPAIASL
ncbi:hypothetical protein [Streptomyces longhuiensis]|uniref:hypothetical protein n=1 Tax=Streptomyces longhuiensis TaxID=2880933 RepID=UPI001D09E9AF|nr:hypothetical protein [Streptomyces longhuiensis]UDM00089.1 hypothetical protein LGI35_18275 [Streptomyces longhuiensis]